MGSGSNRIVLDWDGTCVEEIWPGNDGDWLPGAVDSIKEMLDAGYEVMIHSTRLSKMDVDEVTPFEGHEETVRHIREKLQKAGLHEVGIWLQDWKPGAIAYIDDKAIKFSGNWEEIMKEINKIEVVR